MIRRTIRHMHFYCGLGGGALGFNRGQARTGRSVAEFECIGGIDVDAAAVRDFTRLTGTPGTVLDLFSPEQYAAFHGRPPPAGWQEATVDDIRRAAAGKRPHIVFFSAPCKGFSALLNKKSAKTAKYLALNELALRGLLFALSAWEDDPPELILFENVPRIQQRGARFLDLIEGLLTSHGYAVARTTHDCGELGGLAQHRQRFLLVARHREKVPPFLYEPPRRRLQAVGDVLGGLPLPEDPAGGPMHTLPRLQWQTWLRLALVEAGKDWRSLQDLDVDEGVVQGIRLQPLRAWHRGVLGVRRWEESTGAVTGRASPTTGAHSVADPRLAGRRFNNVYRVIRWDEASQAVTGGTGPTAGGLAVQDPRPPRDLGRYTPYGVLPWDEASGTVTAQAAPGAGVFSVADPRPSAWVDGRATWAAGGHYGVVRWEEPSGAVVGAAQHDRGRWSVADPRLPGPKERPDPVPLIVSLDGTWHRPFTTLELAALQSFPVEDLVLDGSSHSAWRGRIGNAVPPDAAAAVASVMGTTLLLAWEGTTFTLGSTPVWVRPLAVALSVDVPEALPC